MILEQIEEDAWALAESELEQRDGRLRILQPAAALKRRDGSPTVARSEAGSGPPSRLRRYGGQPPPES